MHTVTLALLRPGKVLAQQLACRKRGHGMWQPEAEVPTTSPSGRASARWGGQKVGAMHACGHDCHSTFCTFSAVMGAAS
jgi:hypothetical protein